MQDIDSRITTKAYLSSDNIQELEIKVSKGEETKKAFENGVYCVFCGNLFAIFREDVDCCEEHNGACGVIIIKRIFANLFLYLMILLGGLLTGIVFQLGLLFISGKGLHTIRMVEIL